MTVITISRCAYGGVEQLVERLAGEFGYRVLSREQLLADTSTRFKTSASQLESALQHRPGLLEGRGLTKLHFLYCVQAMMAKAAQADNLVYHGEQGHLLLPGIAHHLRVRTLANAEQRVTAIMEACDLSRDKAVEYMRNLDEQRRDWARWVHGIDTDEPTLFDLLVNLERVSVPAACAVIGTAARSGFQATPESQRAMDDLALLSDIRAVIGLDKNISGDRVAVEVRDGAVTIRGGVRFLSDLERTADVARGMPGVVRVAVDTTPDRSTRG